MISKTFGILAMAAVAGTASADVIVSYSYTDLNGFFDSDTGIFVANAEDSGNLNSGGDVSRLISPTGTAQFDTGFLGLGGFANVEIELDVFNITATSADASGTVLILDNDGDQLRADISGVWTIFEPVGFMFFAGTAENYQFFNDNPDDDTFDGTTGSFEMSDLVDRLFNGALSILLQNPGGFSDSFDRASTQADGVLIPTPGAVAIAAVGLVGLTASRRRR